MAVAFDLVEFAFWGRVATLAGGQSRPLVID